MKRPMLAAIVLAAFAAFADSAIPACAIVEREDIWPSVEAIPDFQPRQIALRTEEKAAPEGHDKAMPHLEWYAAPKAEGKTDACMIIISGGAYQNCCDGYWVDWLARRLVKRGVTCVSLVYRTPRPSGLPIYQSGWQDGQRAVRLVRSQAAKRGYDPEKIGAMGFSAGSHLTVMLATSALTPAYAKVDAVDDIPCHVNWAVPIYTAYGLTDGLTGPNSRDGDSPDVKLNPSFKFDEKTCPMCMFHGGVDIYSPNASTQIYRQLRRMKIPAELHLFGGRNHGFFSGAKPGTGAANWYGRIEEFMTQMGYLGPVPPEEKLMDRFPSDADRAIYAKEDVWPGRRIPDLQKSQLVPYIEWHIPSNLTTKAIQIIYSGGSYMSNSPDSFEVAPARRYLNSKGMAVVTLRYRTPRPAAPLAKHVTAWQDLQRAIRLVRSKAASYGLDPDQIGIMGSSAGGHLTILGATSSRHRAYFPVSGDKVDALPCNVQWAVAIYPAYALTDGLDKGNVTGGNDDEARLAPEFSFDVDTCPMLFVHGDADGWAAMNSVKCWEQLRRMGIQGDLHTLALRNHCFQSKASPGTGSYTWLDRIWEFMQVNVPFGGVRSEPAPMATKWGEKVTESNAWTLYPRPQMVREGWKNLNGLWDYSILTNSWASTGEMEKGRILVPFCFESPLSGVQRTIDPAETMLYSRTFDWRREEGRRVLLHFEAVDWRAHVFVNGKEAGLPHEGGNLPFEYDVTKLVKDGENKLEVYVWDPTHTFINAGGKQSNVSSGCFYTRVSGIWQTVWLESVPETYIADFAVTPDIDRGEVTLKFEVENGRAAEGELEIAAPASVKAKFRPGEPVTVKLPAPVALWSPDSPSLYDFTARIGKDSVKGYFAMRKFSKAKDLKGRWRFMLNNKPFFPYGTLDQGWWPDGLLTPPSEEAMAFDIKTLKDCGFNMMRKHIKVEPRRYYALCDRLGIVVFQDAPSPAGASNIFDATKNLQRYGMFRAEWKAEMDHLMKVPSICVWIPYNEGWGQPDARLTAATLRWTREYDPTRLVDGPSGWFDFEGGDPGKRNRAVFTSEAEDPSCDIVDHHVYRGPGQSAHRKNRVSLLGEFGGLGHPVEGHLWTKTSWGYGGVADTSTREGLMNVYSGLVKKLLPMVDDGLAGAIYTQTTDVEQEINGLLTYDRKVLKFDPEKLKALHAELISRGESFEAAPDCVLLDL